MRCKSSPGGFSLLVVVVVLLLLLWRGCVYRENLRSSMPLEGRAKNCRWNF